jgi:hypothetical protein
MRKLLLSLAIFFSSQAFAAGPTLEDYLNAGIAAPSRMWVGADYARAAQVFGQGQIALPRYADDAGAKVMGRLVSLDNFHFYRLKSVPIESRFVDYVSLIQGLSSVLNTYVSKIREGERSLSELASLLAFTLHTSALGLDLADEFVPTIPKDNNYAARMAGLKKMHSGIVTIFGGAESVLADDSGVSPADRTLVVNAMATTLPVLKQAFPPDFRIEIRKRLEKSRSILKLAGDRDAVDRMLKELAE